MVASFGLTEPCLLASRARMCLAGDGGGKGRLKIRRGVEETLFELELELAGECLKKVGKGLGVKKGNFDDDLVDAW